MGYDIIGDVHGYACELRALLEKMGYRESRGAYRHSSRIAIFVGDLIDRGSANIEAATIARQMAEQGTTWIVMGNHEFNAIAFHTEDPERAGEFLRPHNSKNLKQHHATLLEFAARPDQKDLLLDWFRAQPLFLDLPEIRVVHACWDRRSLAEIKPRLNADNSMPEALFVAACRKGSSEHAARDTLVNGPEIDLPDGVSFLDKDGHRRTAMRLKWWLCGSAYLSFRNAGLGLADAEQAVYPIMICQRKRIIASRPIVSLRSSATIGAETCPLHQPRRPLSAWTIASREAARWSPTAGMASRV